MEISDDVKSALTEKYGEVVFVDTKGGPCAFRACTRAEHDRYQSLLFDKKTQAKAGETLVLATVVYPDRQTFQAICEKAPFTTSTCFQAVAELSGMVLEPEVKKCAKGQEGT